MIKKIALPLLFSLLIFAVSCDYITKPGKFKPDANSGAACPKQTFPVNSSPIRKILVEDYTGHLCGNCPAAALIIKNTIMPAHPDQAIPISIHAGSAFAQPVGNPYTAEFRTSPGESYDQFFGISAISNPNGMIDRIHYSATAKTHVKSKDKWAVLVDSLALVPPVADIQIINLYNNSDSSVCIHIQTTFLTALTGKYNLVVLLTQDSIVATQKDYTANPTDISSYVHRHVLRDAINGADGKGELIINSDTNTIVNGTKVYTKHQYPIKNFYGYNNLKNIACNVDQCYIIAFVYNIANNEILQAEEQKVK